MEGFRCTECGGDSTRVTDSRNAYKVEGTRRRRECINCGFRFTTYEQRAEAGIKQLMEAELRKLREDVAERIHGFEQSVWEVIG